MTRIIIVRKVSIGSFQSLAKHWCGSGFSSWLLCLCRVDFLTTPESHSAVTFKMELLPWATGIKQYRCHDPGICLCWAFCFEDVLLASLPLIWGIFPGSLWNSEETSVWPPESQSKNKRNGPWCVVSRRRCATPSARIKSRAALPVNWRLCDDRRAIALHWGPWRHRWACTQPSHGGVMYQRTVICVTDL